MKDNADSAYVRLISVTFGDTTYDEKSANVATKERPNDFQNVLLDPIVPLVFSGLAPNQVVGYQNHS